MENLTIPQNPTEEAAALGYPATLFGFTPDQRGYWQEPGLPRVPLNERTAAAPERFGQPDYWCISEFQTDSMAPRFPRGTWAHSGLVFHREQLVVGKVYTYEYADAETGETRHDVGRLEVIGGNYLTVSHDNHPVKSLWMLGEKPGNELRDVREITHYLHYPAL